MNVASPPQNAAKKAAGTAASDLIQDGMLVGLGTGQTANYFMEALALRCQEGLKIKAVATSLISQKIAQNLKIPLVDMRSITTLDIDIDGTDEIDGNKNMIKGGSGSIVREKLIASASREMVVIVDEAKFVKSLGAFPVAVEILPFLYQTTLKRLQEFECDANLRLKQDQTPFITDNGNYIVDVQFKSPIKNVPATHSTLKSMVGVIETGLFFDIAGRVIVGYADGSVKTLS